MKLIRANVNDCEKIWKMQTEAFSDLLERYQDYETSPGNKGLAQKAFEEVEKIHGHDNWKLDTILQEEGNCYLYEKLGYKRTGLVENINDKMDIVYYEKN